MTPEKQDGQQQQAVPSRVVTLSIALRYTLAALAVVAAGYSGVLALAAYLFDQDTPASVAAAVRLAPKNSVYLTRLAAWDPGRRAELLASAVRVNPFDDSAWERLALDAEVQRHNLPEAEHDFLQAAHYNHMFLPRLTLTNFYFRHGEKEKFLHWSQAALDITPYPADPIFANMWLYEPDAKQLAAFIPNRPGILAQYVIFLGASRQYEALPTVVARLVKAGADNPTGWGLNDIVGPMEDRLLASGNGSLAQEIWRTLVEGHWLDYTVVNASHPLTNGDFRIPFWGHGFDWTTPGGIGLTIAQDAEAPDIRFTFDGNQEDRVTLLRQWVPLTPGQPYRLGWLASSEALHQPSGLSWQLQAGETPLSSGDLLPEKGLPQWDFSIPNSAPPTAMLSLQYARPLGEMHANGTLILQAVKLTTR